MKTGYKTSKAPYVDIHYGDIVEYYKGGGFFKIVWRFGVKMKPRKGRAFPMLKIERVVYGKNGVNDG